MVRKLFEGMMFGAILALSATGIASAHPSVDVVASNWKFTPAAIEAHVG